MSTIEETIGKAESVGEVLGLAVGAGSTCWENMEGTGLFQEQQASAVVRAAEERIKELTK